MNFYFQPAGAGVDRPPKDDPHSLVPPDKPLYYSINALGYSPA